MTILPLPAAARYATFFLFLSGLAPAQIAAPRPPAEVSLHFERQGLAVPKFTLSVDETGNARYVADEVIAARDGSEADPPPTQHLVRTVTLSKSTTDRIFSTARALDRFNVPCASKAKNIAYTGTKMLRYTGGDGDGSCTYNYSQDKQVVVLTELFQGIARTLDMGRKLDFQHRFDRLGLDTTMANLTDEVDNGRAKEISVIAPTLRSLVEDAAILQRVRQRAARLLELTQSPS